MSGLEQLSGVDTADYAGAKHEDPLGLAHVLQKTTERNCILAREAPGVCYYYVMRSIGERSTDPGLLVLTSLAEGPKHGYAITLDVERLSGVRLGPGTLYGALARLEENGLIEALPAEDRRHPYRLTGAGSAALTEHLQTLERVARRGLDRLRAAEALR
jgi:DNA-binding PadR family transcriptional regulator